MRLEVRRYLAYAKELEHVSRADEIQIAARMDELWNEFTEEEQQEIERRLVEEVAL
jgi:hypothetical protein